MLQLLQSAPPAAGGSAAWSLANSWTYSADVANVDFTNLGSYNELMLLVRNITVSVSGVRVLYVSTDNGANYRNTSGDYVNLVANNIEANTTGVGFGTSNSALARSGIIKIPQSGLNGVPKIIENQTLGLGSVFVQSTSPINAVRITNNTGGNLTGGTIHVFGR
ncbi:hypothetical protein ASD12_18080 [Mesorhizobium sp. Root102]|uniref:hypothetical protein n=1 Tax=Mesorhizobium sp. Root102 TaxID=1736422 RepID=UPI0006FEF902|nr:hypothetical protein [Mesorhizobium sp. Root102]KQU77709.1 hypothetical protein ASD12_18080 [Mesorhizobium sp. Root102]